MKLKYQFAIRKIGDQIIAVSAGRGEDRFHGMLKLNESGEWILRLLNTSEWTQEQITELFADRYEVSREVAGAKVQGFLDALRQAELLEE